MPLKEARGIAYGRSAKWEKVDFRRERAIAVHGATPNANGETTWGDAVYSRRPTGCISRGMHLLASEDYGAHSSMGIWMCQKAPAAALTRHSARSGSFYLVVPN